ncbi:MAG: hypothetical protein ACJ74W_21015 [Pyrinomonadaceae bacterium]
MKRSQDKIKDYVEPQAFDEVRDFAADPARVVAAYRFTDATSDLLARWLDALADLPPGRGAARALAGLRGVGKSHLLATFGALVAAPELRPRVPDAHVAVSAKRLAGRRAQVVRVERGTRPALVEELRAAFIAAFGRAATEWPDDPVALIAAAVEHVHGATLVLIIDTAYGREQRVERDDGPLLSQLATAAQGTDAFVALALDDDIAGADGINAALVQTYQIDYLEPEHLYRVADLYLLRKQAQARTALHEIYLTLRHTIPNFNWSEPRFAALYPVHPLVADVAASVRLYATTFAFLPFASASALQALNRPALSLVLLDEVFDRTEAELRAAKDLQDAFATYDELSTNGVAKFPAMQRLQVRLVLKLLFVLSLDGRGASARDLCAALLFHDESAPLAAVQRIDAMLQHLAALAPADGLSARAEQDELRYRFRIGAAREFDEALAAAVKRLPADDAVTLGKLLRSFAHARFNDWPASADESETNASLHANWRGTSRRGRFKLHVDAAASSIVAPAPVAATHYEWGLSVLAPDADGLPAALVDKQTRPTNADDSQQPISLVWQPARMTGDDAVVLRRLLALRTDPALGAFVEPALAAHAALSTQAEHIWTRLHLDEGVLTCAGAQLALRERAQSAPTLSALLAALLDEPLAARYPQHPHFAASLNESDCARLVECMFGTVPESDAQPLIAQFALPLGLARARDDGTHTLECGETALAQSWCQTALTIVEQAGKSGVTFAALQYALGRAPFGLSAAAQHLVIAALIAQRRLELVTPTGERLGRSAAAGGIDWANVAGVACAVIAQHDVEALTVWARQLTNNNALASLAEAGARASLRAALGAWLADWRAHALVGRCEQLPDSGLTLRVWQLVKLVRRTFGVAAEAVAATLADTISLEEGLQRVADAFGNSPVQFAESAAARAALTAYIAELAEREQVRAYLAGAEPTGVEEIECARRELLLSTDDAHSLFDDGACARFDLLWQEFHTRYAAHYADLHEHAVGARNERAAIDEALRSDAWREFEALAQLPFVNRQHRQEADTLIAELRRAHCELDVRALLATQPTCACAFRLTRAACLLNAAARLTEIISRGRAAARRTLALFHPHFARALNLLAHEKSSATGARAGQLAAAFARGETPALLARADVRLIARAFEISPPPEPLHIPAPDLNHGAVTRAELHARMAVWLADLPHSPALVEVAAKMGSDGA